MPPRRVIHRIIREVVRLRWVSTRISSSLRLKRDECGSKVGHRSLFFSIREPASALSFYRLRQETESFIFVPKSDESHGSTSVSGYSGGDSSYEAADEARAFKLRKKKQASCTSFKSWMIQFIFFQKMELKRQEHPLWKQDPPRLRRSSASEWYRSSSVSQEGLLAFWKIVGTNQTGQKKSKTISRSSKRDSFLSFFIVSQPCTFIQFEFVCLSGLSVVESKRSSSWPTPRSLVK